MPPSFKKMMSELPADAIDYFFAALELVNTTHINEDSLNQALTRYRMACTNVPTSQQELSDSRTCLDEALMSFLGGEGLSKVQKSWASAQSSRKNVEKLPAFKRKGVYAKEQMQCIVPGLYLGSYHPAADLGALREEGITHVLCCIDVTPRFPSDMTYMILPAADNASYDIAQYFRKTNQFIFDCISQGGKVLVHCGAGISRAPTVAAAYLITSLKIGAPQAVQHIRKYRQCAQPNLGFAAQLKEYAAKSNCAANSSSTGSDMRVVLINPNKNKTLFVA